MTTPRDVLDFPGGKLISVLLTDGKRDVVDKDEYEKQVDDDLVVGETASDDPMTLEGCFPGISDVL